MAKGKGGGRSSGRRSIGKGPHKSAGSGKFVSNAAAARWPGHTYSIGGKKK
ncbi:MAG TPA: hypothetical protein VGV67_09895 [Solirubrobacteraceae bacterium]|nr:hypothetical protein [Solirubrobacteraceae bacterium]